MQNEEAQMQKLHEWYMKASHDGDIYLTLGIKDEESTSGGRRR
jgi:hypothetical protein